MSQTGHRTYRGHRRHSFVASDVNELIELRARHRTFHGAYSRAALSILGYALTILRLFDASFRHIGLLFAILGAFLFATAFFRSRRSRHDFADPHGEHDSHIQGMKSIGQDKGRIFGRSVITAGWNVIQVTAIVAVVEIILFVLILRHKSS